jgi:hypothetical protein
MKAMSSTATCPALSCRPAGWTIACGSRSASTTSSNKAIRRQCYTCDSANFDPTTYDLPGQFGYLRLSYGF